MSKRLGGKNLHPVFVALGEAASYNLYMNARGNPVYEEKITSRRTEALFVSLTILFLLLLVWHMNAAGMDILSIILFFFCGLFFFYSLNYRALIICLTPDSLKLTFGLFTRTVPVEDIESCSLDDPPPVKKYGGAGIHFMFVDGRYRASFNFLEYPRVVVALKGYGRVRDVSFTTRRPDEVLRFLHEAMTSRASA